MRATKKLADVEDELLDMEIELAEAEEKFAAFVAQRSAAVRKRRRLMQTRARLRAEANLATEKEKKRFNEEMARCDRLEQMEREAGLLDGLPSSVELDRQSLALRQVELPSEFALTEFPPDFDWVGLSLPGTDLSVTGSSGP